MYILQRFLQKDKRHVAKLCFDQKEVNENYITYVRT